MAALHGNALGGGLELAMACHYRVATADARVGQPEVLLGIIPGAGGTQRLPRLAGPAMALEMCTLGKPVPAASAQSNGILDLVVSGDLRQAAIIFASERAGEVRKTRQRAEFFLMQVTSALSPSNFPITNPEVFRNTLATSG